MMESGEKELGVCDYTGRLRLWGWVNQVIFGVVEALVPLQVECPPTNHDNLDQAWRQHLGQH